MDIYCPLVKTLTKGKKSCIFPKWLEVIKEELDGEGTEHLFHLFLAPFLSLFLKILIQGHFFISFIERKEEKETSMWESNVGVRYIDWLLPLRTQTVDWTSNLGLYPGQGIKPTTFWLQNKAPTSWATLASAPLLLNWVVHVTRHQKPFPLPTFSLPYRDSISENSSSAFRQWNDSQINKQHNWHYILLD